VKIFKKGTLSEKDIHSWLVELRPYAYIPESGFAVSVVLRANLGAENDYYFAGVNVENVDHRLSTHGEEGAIAAMITALGKQAKILELWCMGAPPSLKPGDKDTAADVCTSCCGKCRQQIAGFAAMDARINYVSLNGRTETTTVGAFLPALFSLPVAPPLQKPVAVSAAQVEQKLLRKGPLAQADIETWLKSLEPVDLISKVSQSIVVELDNSFYVAGTRVEEAAFIDISVVQSAMAIATGAFGAFKVKGVWIYTCGHTSENRALLSLSSLQALLEFGYDRSLPLHYVVDNEIMSKATLSEAISAWK
jgi:cytidine deaminase